MNNIFRHQYAMTGVLVGLLIAITGTAYGARQADAVPRLETFTLQSPIASPLIKRLQQALLARSYFKGQVSGILDRQTEDALRTYQRLENLVVDGIVTEKLVKRLESSVKIQSLLRQLQTQRLVKMAAARKALLQNPETRNLLSKKPATEATADAARDPGPCFAAATPECLLAEASQSARAIFNDELRFWALSEILVAEAKAGLLDKAMTTVGRIDDPRLIIVALRDIAEAQARAGRPMEALAAVRIIPDALKRAEALAAIAAIQARASEPAQGRTGALRTLGQLSETIAKIDDPLKRIALQAQAAITRYISGDDDSAMASLARLRVEAEALDDDKSRSIGLRHVAGALADIEQPELALDILKALPELAEHTPVLVSAAAAQAQAGRSDLALVTASSIETVRYRAVVLGRIALAQATAEQMPSARKTLDKAFAAIKEIKLPFAQAYAHEQMAQVLNAMARLQTGEAAQATFRLAVTSAARISDNMLRARSLWSITLAQEISGDIAGAKMTKGLAEAATLSIRSQLTKVWMFSTIAIDHQSGTARQQARQAFARALAVGKDISNPWARARALARLASTLVDLSAGD